MPYQTIWVEPEILYQEKEVTILASYHEDEWEEPQCYWVRPIPTGYDLSAEVEFESIDLREIGFRGDFRDEPERLDFIRKAVADGRLKPVRR
jgi:hypothetical protein